MDDKKILIRHIKRLQQRNRMLSEVIADERLARRNACRKLQVAKIGYQAKLNSRVMWMFDYFYMAKQL